MESNPVIISDKEFYPFISAEKTGEIVARLASAIRADYQGESPVVLVVLNGAFIFASDLLRKIDFHCEVSFIKLASYVGTQSGGRVQKLIGMSLKPEGKKVLIVEDIIDTGNTLEALLDEVRKCGPSDIKICTLLLKPAVYKGDTKIDYVGLEIANDFVIGYGMDYNGLGRNISGIYKLKNKESC